MSTTNANKHFCLLSLERLSDFKQHLNKIKVKNFTVLLLNNRNIIKKEVLDVAKELISRGLTIMSAWGQDTDKIEQIFDNVCVENYIDTDDKRHLGLLTTSEQQDPLDEVLNSFIYIGLSEKEHNANLRIIILIGANNWRRKIEKQVRDFFNYMELELEYWQ